MKQPYIYSTKADIAFICAPPFMCWLLVLVFPHTFLNTSGMSEIWWVVLILGIDVTHVYTTLYKTYFNRDNFLRHKKTFVLIPVVCFVFSFLLYAFGSQVFWRLLAYAAVFHFIRQQYGFMRLYSRNEPESFLKKMDSWAIYASMLYPVVYWHTNGPFEFNWFIKNDFIFFRSLRIDTVCKIGYYVIISMWFIKEVYILARNKTMNIPKFLIITGTGLSWYFGIVYYQSDLTFTLFNVVCHGVPYMALVWMDQNKEQTKGKTITFSKIQQLIANKKYILLFLLIPFLLGYVEEFFWNSFIWQESKTIFAFVHTKKYTLSSEIKQVLVPILILPQLTHYIIDGFIWKISKGHITT
jgi:hypothetical protein